MVEGFQAKSCSVPFWNLNNCWIDGRCKKTNWSSLPTRLMNFFKTFDLIFLLKSVLVFFLYLNEKMNKWSIKQNYCRYTILQKFPYPFLSMISKNTNTEGLEGGKISDEAKANLQIPDLPFYEKSEVWKLWQKSVWFMTFFG